MSAGSSGQSVPLKKNVQIEKHPPKNTTLDVKIDDELDLSMLHQAMNVQIEYLQKLTDLIIEGLSDDSGSNKIMQYSNQLSRMAVDLKNNPPQLFNGDLDVLDKMLIVLNQKSTYLSEDKNYQYWVTEASMFQDLSATLEKYIKVVEKVYLKVSTVSSLVTATTFLNTFLSDRPAHPLNEEFFHELLALQRAYAYLPLPKQAKLKEFLDNIYKMEFVGAGGKKFEIGRCLAYAQIYEIIDGLLQSDPQISLTLLVKAMTKRVEEKPQLTLNAIVKETLNDFPSLLPRFGKVINGRISLQRPEIFYGRYEGVLKDHSNVPKLDELISEKEGASAIAQSDILLKQLNVLQAAHYQLEKDQYIALMRVHHSIGCSIKIFAAKGVLSLQEKFAQVISGHYMFLEEKFWHEKAQFLSWSHMQESIYRTLLQIIEGFSSAKTEFNFSSFLRFATTKWIKVFTRDDKMVTYPCTFYPGSISGVKQKLFKERETVTSFVAAIKDAMATIKTYLYDLSYPDGKVVKIFQPNKSDINSLVTNLQDAYRNFAGAQANLQILGNLLDKISIEPANPSLPQLSSKFSIKWGAGTLIKSEQEMRLKLQEYEGNVLHGERVSLDEGVRSIHESFLKSLQKASSTSQIAQTQLQIMMTQSIQEWMVVTTAIQIFNQAYMTIKNSTSII